MNRRSLLALIGFAPIATAAAALPRVADPVKLASTGGRAISLKELGDTLGNVHIENAIVGGVIVGTSQVPFETYLPGVVDDVVNNLNANMIWIDAQSRECKGIIKRIDTLNQ